MRTSSVVQAIDTMVPWCNWVEREEGVTRKYGPVLTRVIWLV